MSKNRPKQNTKNSRKDYHAESDDSSDDEDYDFDEGSHCYACRGSYLPGLIDNNDAQIMRVINMINVITGITTCAKMSTVKIKLCCTSAGNVKNF